jgi:acylphosphatase
VYLSSRQAQATQLSLSGWVRNRRDGSVEASVSGEDWAVEVLTDWAQRRFAIDRALSSVIVLAALIPLIIAYRLLPAGTPLFLAGMAASVLFMTMLYGPVFTVIEAELPPHLKATATGINILALNILMIGGLYYAIGASSQMQAESGFAASWTYPLLGADIVAFAGLPMVWRAVRASPSIPIAFTKGEAA